MCGTQHTLNKESETMPLRDYFDAKRTGTHDAYVGVPLADLSAATRGDALECDASLNNVLARRRPTLLPAPPGT